MADRVHAMGEKKYDEHIQRALNRPYYYGYPMDFPYSVKLRQAAEQHRQSGTGGPSRDPCLKPGSPWKSSDRNVFLLRRTLMILKDRAISAADGRAATLPGPPAGCWRRAPP